MKPLNFNTDIRVNIRIYKVVTRLLATLLTRVEMINDMLIYITLHVTLVSNVLIERFES